MITAKHQILIVGGGTAGIAVAARLLRKGYTDVAVIEPSTTHYYQPLWTLVGGGQAKASTTARPESSVMPKGAAWIKNAANAVDPDNQTVSCADGATHEYDVLVVCPGIQLDWNRTNGLEEALGKDGVSSNYRFDLAPRTWDLIRSLQSGSAVFMVPSGPIKCAGAPQKIAYLASDHWRKAGVLNNIDVHLVVPTPRLFGIPALAENLEAIAADYGITVHTNSEVTTVDAQAHKVAITSVGAGGSDTTLSYDLLHAVPRQSAPDWVKTSPLSTGDANGYVDIDKHDAAPAVPQRVQPRRRRIVAELQDRRRGPQAGPGRRQQHRRVPEKPTVASQLRRLRVLSNRHVIARDAAGRVRLRPEPTAVIPADRPDEAAPGVLVSEEVRPTVHVLELDAQRPRLRPARTSSKPLDIQCI
jgi:sulfide:quinone oxidoreductase